MLMLTRDVEIILFGLTMEFRRLILVYINYVIPIQ